RIETSRKLANYFPPLTLRGFEFGDPKSSGKGDLNLIFTRPSLRLAGRTTHEKAARWTPAKFDPGHFALRAGFLSFKRRNDRRNISPSRRRKQPKPDSANDP